MKDSTLRFLLRLLWIACVATCAGMMAYGVKLGLDRLACWKLPW
jgi:hypothetical protein